MSLLLQELDMLEGEWGVAARLEALREQTSCS